MIHPEVVPLIAAEKARMRKTHSHLSEEFLDDMAYNYVQACLMADTELLKEVYHVRLSPRTNSL